MCQNSFYLSASIGSWTALRAVRCFEETRTPALLVSSVLYKNTGPKNPPVRQSDFQLPASIIAAGGDQMALSRTVIRPEDFVLPEGVLCLQTKVDFIETGDLLPDRRLRRFVEYTVYTTLLADSGHTEKTRLVYIDRRFPVNYITVSYLYRLRVNVIAEVFLPITYTQRLYSYEVSLSYYLSVLLSLLVDNYIISKNRLHVNTLKWQSSQHTPALSNGRN